MKTARMKLVIMFIPILFVGWFILTLGVSRERDRRSRPPITFVPPVAFVGNPTPNPAQRERLRKSQVRWGNCVFFSDVHNITNHLALLYLYEGKACEAVSMTRTSLDCYTELSEWEHYVSSEFLLTKYAAPIEGIFRQTFTELFLAAWHHYFAQCMRKEPRLPYAYTNDRHNILEKLKTTPKPSSWSLNYYNWDGIRFALGQNWCWHPNMTGMTNFHRFYRVLPLNTTEPLPQEDLDDFGHLRDPRFKSRFMRNAVLWRAWGKDDRLYDLEGILNVEDPERFLEEHYVDDVIVDGHRGIHWFAGAAWHEHVAHATETLMSIFNFHMLVPEAPAHSIVLSDSTMGNKSSVPGTHQMINAYLQGVAEVTRARWGVMRDLQPYTNKSWICFRNIGLAGLAFMPRCNGRFAHPDHAKLLRDSIMGRILGNHQRQLKKTSFNGKLNVFFLVRLTTRRFENMKFLEKILRDSKFGRYGEISVHLDVEAFDNMPLDQQMRFVQSTDVVVSPHGQGLLNFAWMEANSAAIEIFSPFWHTTDFGNPIVGSGSFYFPLKVHKPPVRPQLEVDCCDNCCESSPGAQYSFNALLEGCNGSRQCNVYVNTTQFVTIFRRAAETVLREKYGLHDL